jgi:predicted transcriptional regulator
VPEERRDVVLDNLKVSVQEYGYEYLSRALDIVKRRKRALEELNNAGFSLRLKFTLIEPQKQIKTTILDWSEQPISIPERLTRELVECSSFRQFRHFVSVSDRGSQPPAREYAESIPSGPENRASPRGADEMTKLTKHASTDEANQTVRRSEFNVPLKEDAGSVRSENTETEKHKPAVFTKAASDEKTKKEASTQAEVIAEILEFVGEEGKPLKQVLEHAVKVLGLKKPEPLLRELLERGHLVKVKKGGETRLVKG